MKQKSEDGSPLQLRQEEEIQIGIRQKTNKQNEAKQTVE